MVNLWERRVPPDHWQETLRQIFAQACVPHVRSRLPVSPVKGIEHAKGLRLAGLFWPGCTTLERLPQWIAEAASLRRRHPDLEILADHVRQHLGHEISRRRYATSRP